MSLYTIGKGGAQMRTALALGEYSREHCNLTKLKLIICLLGLDTVTSTHTHKTTREKMNTNLKGSSDFQAQSFSRGCSLVIEA